MLETYTEWKKFLLNFVNQLKNTQAIDHSLIEHSTLSDEIVRLENGEFKIALVAPFSAGKSTLINSIIGKDLLSMDIRAETSVITKITFDPNIKIEITYVHNPTVEVIETDEFGQPLTYDSCKAVLQKITTVRDETNEERIQQVVVYCPLEICQDNVEIVDTPGLFSRHEKHEAITNKIIPEVNAVIFMIDPDSVGEEHFTDKIRNYVQTAKSSSLEEDGRHIFFVINKIDMFDPKEIENARHELEEVLTGIIMKPNIHEVSAYYGLKGKQLLTGDLGIEQIQKDKKIKIPDPLDPEFPISGRQITAEHAGDILKFSKIKELEKSLGEYLQSKNKYLITDVISSIRFVLSDNINKLKFEINEIQSIMQEDKTMYIGKIDALMAEVDSLSDSTLKNIKDVVTRRIIGGIEGVGLQDELEELIDGQLTDISMDVGRELYKKWTKAKRGITRDTAEDIVQSVIEGAENYLVLQVKELVRQTFLNLKNIISALIADIQQRLDIVTEQLEEAEIKSLGSKIDRIGNLNVDSLVGTTMSKIERAFSNILVSISKEFQGKVQEVSDSSVYEVRKKGVWNWFKDLFGAGEYEEKFDMNRFKRELDNLIEDLTETMKNMVMDSMNEISLPILRMSADIADEINEEVTKIIKNVVNIKHNVLANLQIEMGKNEEEKMASVAQKQRYITIVMEICNRFEERYLQFTEGDFEYELQEQIPIHQ